MDTNRKKRDATCCIVGDMLVKEGEMNITNIKAFFELERELENNEGVACVERSH